MSDGSIPSRSRNEETLSVFPAAEDDVPAEGPDTINQHAFELQAENAKGGPEMTVKPDWTTK